MGIAKFISENYDTSDMNFIGTSAGAPPAMYLALGIDIDDAVEKLMVPYLRYLKSCAFGVLCNLCVSSIVSSSAYFETVKETLNPARDNSRCFIAVSEVTKTGLKKRYITGGCDLASINVACYTSAWIPFVSAPFFQPFSRVGGRLFADGWLSGRDDAGDHKMLVLAPRRFRKLPMSASWLWLDVSYNLEMYKLGHEDAKANRQVFDDFFA
jgi:hypothetical protein